MSYPTLRLFSLCAVSWLFLACSSSDDAGLSGPGSSGGKAGNAGQGGAQAGEGGATGQGGAGGPGGGAAGQGNAGGSVAGQGGSAPGGAGGTGGMTAAGQAGAGGSGAAGQGGAPGGSGGSGQAGSSAGVAGQTTGGSGGSSPDACSGMVTTIAELNKAKAPLSESRLRLENVIATSHRFLVSTSASGCLWGAFVTTPGATVSEYGSIQIVTKGAPPVTDANGNKVCKSDQESSGALPVGLEPGDVLSLTGFLDEFLLASCGKPSAQDPSVILPKPDAGQRQLKDVACVVKTGEGVVPAAREFSDLSTITAIAQGKNTDDVLYKWGGALVKITAPLTTRQDVTSGAKYFNCSAVSNFGDLTFDQVPELTVNNGVYYNDDTCAGPKDGAKRYDFQQPTTFSLVRGIVTLDACSWQLSVRSRCEDFAPVSPTCGAAAECQKPAAPVTQCTGDETTVMACSDGLDNDSDGFSDCNDKDCCPVLADCKIKDPTSYCAKQGGTMQENTFQLCQDGISNDGDSFIDCEDKDCCAVVDCAQTAPLSYCGKGGGAGGAGGAGGSSAEGNPLACVDMLDNDGDGFIDCDDKDCCPFLTTCKVTDPTSYCATH